jgi:heterodisulfide reductase subunit C
VIREVLTGNPERLLESEEIQRCFWCASCYMGCPVGIHFPLLMMQLRYRALEYGKGLRYMIPFKKIALRARADGLTFVPSPRNQERIRKLREGMGVEPWPEVSERARNDYQALFDATGATEFVESLDVEEAEDEELELKYLAGRITHE